jgi:hypothetical protein
VQASLLRYDPVTRTGTVVSDHGVVHPFGAEAMAAGGLRHLRLGQRLSVRLDPDGRRVTALWLGTIGALDRAAAEADTAAAAATDDDD